MPGINFWIDVGDSYGVKLKSGPVWTATSWESSEGLDRSGKFKFSMPANYASTSSAMPDSHLVVQCYTLVNGVVTEVGAGIVDNMEVKIGAKSAVLEVSGNTLLHGLTYSHVASLAIDDGAGGPDTSGPGDIAGLFPSGWSLDSTQGFDTTFKAIKYTFEGETCLAALSKLAELTGEHFRRGAGQTVIWMRGQGSGKLLHGAISGVLQIGETVTGSSSGATGTIAEIGSGWLYITGVEGRFDQTEAIEGATSGATTTLTAAYNPHTGIQAVRGVDPEAFAGHPERCMIEELSQRIDSYESFCGRVYAYGSGNGASRVGLSGASLPALYTAIGYALSSDTKGYYLEHTSTWSAYGIETVKTWTDVDDGQTLLEVAYEWLRRQRTPVNFYKLKIAGLQQMVYPGQILRLNYRHPDLYTYPGSIDLDLIVLERTITLGMEGLRTSLQVATIDRWPAFDAKKIVEEITNAKNYYTHPQ